jgi:hypothetical protein
LVGNTRFIIEDEGTMALLMVRRRVTKKAAMGRPVVVEAIVEVDVVMPFESETVKQQDPVTP